MDDAKTALEWIRDGRIVKAKSRAKWYLVSSDDKTRVALFTKKQTLPRSDFRRVPASKLPKRTGHAVYWTHVEGVLRVWVGSRTDLIALLKEHKFRYLPRTGRWFKDVEADKLENALEAFRQRGYAPVQEELDDTD